MKGKMFFFAQAREGFNFSKMIFFSSFSSPFLENEIKNEMQMATIDMT